jgi:hypothetical protein
MHDSRGITRMYAHLLAFRYKGAFTLNALRTTARQETVAVAGGTLFREPGRAKLTQPHDAAIGIRSAAAPLLKTGATDA